jgi:hypothetical protein
MKLKIDKIQEDSEKLLKIFFAIMMIVVMISVIYITYRFTFFVHRIQKETPDLDVQTKCQADKAYIYLGALTSVKNVKCAGLDPELYHKSELNIGNLNYEDADVCIFKLKENSSDPLRFEISFQDDKGNVYTKREVCGWNIKKSALSYYD